MNAGIDIKSVTDSQGPGISVQVWIYKLQTPSLNDLYMSSETSIAMADITNISSGRGDEIQAELNKIIDKSLTEWPE